MNPALQWTAAEVDAIKARWTFRGDGSADIPDGAWPDCLVEDCSYKCCLSELSKLCGPCTLRMRAGGEA